MALPFFIMVIIKDAVRNAQHHPLQKILANICM